VYPGCPPEIIVEITKDLKLKGAEKSIDGAPTVAIQVATLILHTFQPCTIQDIIIEGSSGYLENLLHVDCLEVIPHLDSPSRCHDSLSWCCPGEVDECHSSWWW